jgi:transcriptional regulator with XRE-family HTH domain
MNRQELTVKELAKKSGVTHWAIHSWFKDLAKIPNAVNAVAVAKVLKTSVEYLITGEDNRYC